MTNEAILNSTVFSRDEKILELATNGLEPKEIAKLMNMHPLPVRGILYKYNQRTQDGDRTAIVKPIVIKTNGKVKTKADIEVENENDEDDSDDETSVDFKPKVVIKPKIVAKAAFVPVPKPSAAKVRKPKYPSLAVKEITVEDEQEFIADSSIPK